MALVAHILHASTMAFAKFSIILTYLRIFTVDPHFRLLMLSIAIIATFLFTFTFYLLRFCSPGIYPSKLASSHPLPESPDGHEWQFCQDANPFVLFYVTGTFHALTNLILFTAPLPIIWALHMSKRRRIFVCLLFGSGIW